MNSELAMKVGDSYQLEVIIEPLSSTYANTVSWTSSDPNVATVDAAGNVTAVYTGECEIIAKAGHKTASCRVVVVLVYDFKFPQAKTFSTAMPTNRKATILRCASILKVFMFPTMAKFPVKDFSQSRFASADNRKTCAGR